MNFEHRTLKRGEPEWFDAFADFLWSLTDREVTQITVRIVARRLLQEHSEQELDQDQGHVEGDRDDHLEQEQLDWSGND